MLGLWFYIIDVPVEIYYDTNTITMTNFMIFYLLVIYIILLMLTQTTGDTFNECLKVDGNTISLRLVGIRLYVFA